MFYKDMSKVFLDPDGNFFGENNGDYLHPTVKRCDIRGSAILGKLERLITVR